MQRVESLIPFGGEELVHPGSELREGVPVFQGREDLIVEPLEDLGLRIAADGEGKPPVFLRDTVEHGGGHGDALLEILDGLLEGHVLPVEYGLNLVHLRATSPRGLRRA